MGESFEGRLCGHARESTPTAATSPTLEWTVTEVSLFLRERAPSPPD